MEPDINYVFCYNQVMEIVRTDPLPFSDYMIFYFVDLFGVAWIDFYYYILVAIFVFAVLGWAWGVHMYVNCRRYIHEAVEETIEEHKK